jgi:hypothetical protein
MFGIVFAPLAIEIPTKQLGGARRKAEELDAAAVTALAEGAGLLPQATRMPVSERQANNLGDASSGLKEDPCYTLLPQSPTSGATTRQDACWERRVVDYLRYPVLAGQFEVAVREPGACLRCNHAAVVWHPGRAGIGPGADAQA